MGTIRVYLKEHLKARGWLQKRLKQEAGGNKDTISQVCKTGKARPDTVEPWARALGISVEELTRPPVPGQYDGVSDSTSSATQAKEDLSKDTIEEDARLVNEYIRNRSSKYGTKDNRLRLLLEAAQQTAREEDGYSDRGDFDQTDVSESGEYDQTRP